MSASRNYHQIEGVRQVPSWPNNTSAPLISISLTLITISWTSSFTVESILTRPS